MIVTLKDAPSWIVIAFVIFSIVLPLGIGIFIEIVISGLKKRKYWTWIAGIIICSIYLPSLFIVLGIIGLVGLLDEKVKKEFSKIK